MEILVVDDEVVSRKKIHKIMENFGKCVAVENGESALNAFKTAHDMSTPFHLIILDIEMPGMGGMEVLTKIRNLEKQYHIPKSQRSKILMLTSHSEKEIVVKSIQAGCNDYIVKPFDRALIEGKLKKLGLHITHYALRR